MRATSRLKITNLFTNLGQCQLCKSFCPQLACACWQQCRTLIKNKTYLIAEDRKNLYRIILNLPPLKKSDFVACKHKRHTSACASAQYPQLGYSHFFFIRRLGPSFYFLPQKIIRISNTPKNHLKFCNPKQYPNYVHLTLKYHKIHWMYP